jgi:hypothetical protein
MQIGSIVIRCRKFDKMLAFWQEALHYVPREPAKDGWVVLRDPEGRSPNVLGTKRLMKVAEIRRRACTRPYGQPEGEVKDWQDRATTTARRAT